MIWNKLNARAIRALFSLVFILSAGIIIFSNNINYASLLYPPIPDSHYQMITDAVDHCQVPREMRGFIASVARAESGFRPGAASGAGAVGVMQLLRATGYGVAVNYGISGLNASTFTDPAISYKMGTCYIHYIMGKYSGGADKAQWNNPEYLKAVMIGYNAGPAKGQSYLNGGSSYPSSSLAYANKIIGSTAAYTTDFVQWELRQASGEAATPDSVRATIWRYLIGSQP
ncbi:MAG: murein transglycosylase [Candidatus Berkelbacteria bacterium Gr01-1014_85]|uniref:Murein transglycosylase n=1 Tax=Candidatus Berkelbacteria bacterium Gr01-1014_85 TaxID=2017150 RepID=A0A554JA63_9BACT|nr:MAG: murein transglycosylase [Candidatus Berkelbacteria bacterium Gr01-1014_85]